MCSALPPHPFRILGVNKSVNKPADQGGRVRVELVLLEIRRASPG